MRTPNFVLRRMCVVSLALCMCRCDTGSTGYLTATSTGTVQTGGATGDATGGGTTGPSGTTTPGVAADGIAIGLCLEAVGAGTSAHAIADTFWSSTIVGLAQTATGSSPAALLVVGTNTNGTCSLSIPKANAATAAINRVDAVVDPNFDTLLTSLDGLGAKVVLEVQPGNASLSDLATAVLSAYGSHSSVVGFGVDVQYKGTTKYSSTASMSTSEATSLVNTIQSVQSMNSNILLYAKAASPTNLPDPSTSNVVFVNDSTGFGSLDAMMTAQSEWASFFAPSSVQFDIGSPKDANWWCATDALTATTTLMGSALKAGSNVTGLYWQADGIVSLYPNVTCAAASTTTTGTATTSGGTTAAGTTAGTATSGTTSGGSTPGGSTSSGTATNGTTSSGTMSSGTTSSGTTSSGTTSSGTTSSGTTSSGSTSSGTTSSGTTSSGTTSSGTTSSGTTSSGTTSSGTTSSGTTSSGTTSSGTTSAGGTSAGGTSSTSNTTSGGATTGGTSSGTTAGH